ncbi:MAG: hypothetical protein L6R37_002587 [Teloschistes peruensis]|nr:MAG: hypothetical protein L6R37_002587 [Teloschistes peruensis]
MAIGFVTAFPLSLVLMFGITDIHAVLESGLPSMEVFYQITQSKGIATFMMCWVTLVYYGHEIIGIAVRVGSQARGGIKIGDRVGVGPQGYTCRKSDCDSCSSGQENYCPSRVGTYGDQYPNGSISYGGFADYCRHNSYSVFSIPEGLASEDAAVMLCAGSTVYEPLKEHGAGPKTRVGVIGLGGLGHLGVSFARAMGCLRVIAFSRSMTKREDALKLGADEYVATAEQSDWAQRYTSTLDLIICTVSDPRMPLQEYLQLLRPKGRFCQVGIPEEPLPRLDTMPLVLSGTSILFSDSASPGNIREMLELATAKGIKAWTQVRPMREVNEAVADLSKGKARFRFVLQNLDD